MQVGTLRPPRPIGENRMLAIQILGKLRSRQAIADFFRPLTLRTISQLIDSGFTINSR
jgi:hypothetical protein